jgi:hypothetical protein
LGCDFLTNIATLNDPNLGVKALLTRGPISGRKTTIMEESIREEKIIRVGNIIIKLTPFTLQRVLLLVIMNLIKLILLSRFQALRLR